MITVVLGERERAPLTFPAHEWGTQRMFAPEHAAFRDGRGRTKLARLGVSGDWYVNLLPPSAMSGAWKPSYARDMARTLLVHLTVHHGEVSMNPRPIALVCCGSRVSYAAWNAYRGLEAREPLAKYPRTWCDFVWLRNIAMCRVPHPSGRCRIWNDERLASELRERYESALAGLAAKCSP